MNPVRAPSRMVLFVVALAALAVDLGSKAAAVELLRQPIDLTVVTLRVARNPGVAFGVGSSVPAPLILAIVSAVVAHVLVASWRGTLGPAVPAGLIAGGAVANVIDRIHGGTVIDIFDLGWWPVFNLADSFIVVGGVHIVIASIRDPRAPADGRAS